MIKRQTLAKFIAEFSYSNTAEVTGMTNNAETAKAVGVKEKDNSVPTEGDPEQWTISMDDASNDTGSGAGMMLISLEGHKIHCAIRFDLRHQITRSNTRP